MKATTMSKMMKIDYNAVSEVAVDDDDSVKQEWVWYIVHVPIMALKHN